MSVVRGWLATLAVAGLTTAADLTAPWNEFKELYREHIERNLMERFVVPKKPVVVFDQADYRLRLTGDQVFGNVVLQGHVSMAQAATIVVFPGEMILTGRVVATGGELRREEAGLVWAASGTEPFRLEFGFALLCPCLSSGSQARE